MSKAKVVPAPPAVRRCYRRAVDKKVGGGFEYVEVVALCTERPLKIASSNEDLAARREFVVVRHGRHAGSLLGTAPWAIRRAEWDAHGFVFVTRHEFREQSEAHVWSHTGRGWALTIEGSIPPHDSRDVRVVRVLDVSDDGAVTVALGRQKVVRVPLDGAVYAYREDARHAKQAWCEANKLPRCSARGHFDTDLDLP